MTQTDTPTTASNAAVERYLKFWNSDPGPDLESLAATVFREDIDHCGPLGARVGLEEVIEFSRHFSEHLGDATFLARTEPTTHHDRVRVQWEIMRGEESFATGTDVLVLDETGLVTSVTTFLDRAPEGFDPAELR